MPSFVVRKRNEQALLFLVTVWFSFVAMCSANQNCDILLYYTESEIGLLRNTQWHIFHIFTSEYIDHVTFSIYTIFCLRLYNRQNISNYTVAWRYDFYLLVLKTIFYSLAALVRKILFSPLEDKKSYLRAAV
jgi:hypothetical protein